MVDFDVNKIISVFDVDSEVVYDELNKKWWLLDFFVFFGCKWFCFVCENMLGSFD